MQGPRASAALDLFLRHAGGPITGPAAGPGSSNTQGLTATVASLPTVTNQNRDGVIDKSKVLGINFASQGVGDRLRKTVTSASGSTTADAGMLFISTTGELSGSGSVTNFTLVNMVGSNSGNFISSTTRRTQGLEDNDSFEVCGSCI